MQQRTLQIATMRGTARPAPVERRTIRVTVRIETSRLLIRPFREEDGEAWLSLVNNADVNRYLPGDGEAVTLDDFRQALERRVNSEREAGYAMWAVDRRDTGEFVGQCGLYLSEKKGPEIELAYHYLPATWGHGYATEAARVVLGYAFGTLRLDEVIALVMRGNTGSSRVVEKAGMRLVTDEATYYDLPHLQKYALTRVEWQRLGTAASPD